MSSQFLLTALDLRWRSRRGGGISGSRGSIRNRPGPHRPREEYPLIDPHCSELDPDLICRTVLRWSSDLCREKLSSFRLYLIHDRLHNLLDVVGVKRVSEFSSSSGNDLLNDRHYVLNPNLNLDLFTYTTARHNLILCGRNCTL
jgi:hypothetical protein